MTQPEFSMSGLDDNPNSLKNFLQQGGLTGSTGTNGSMQQQHRISGGAVNGVQLGNNGATMQQMASNPGSHLSEFSVILML